MAITDQVRNWYRETVANHLDRGKPGYEPRKNWIEGHTFVRVGFPRNGGGVFREPVHIRTKLAWLVFTALMEEHNVEMSSAGGVDSLRNIGDSNWPSLHAYLCACDLPPNSYQPEAFIAEVLQLRTNSGKQVFKNLASANDRMHSQINCSPDDLATGIVGWTMEGTRIVADTHKHLISPDDMPRDWADNLWPAYFAAGGSSIEESRNWEAYRDDFAWFHHKFIVPLHKRIDEVKAALEDLGVLELGDLLDDVAKLKAFEKEVRGL